jgi:hypothetical protein
MTTADKCIKQLAESNLRQLPGSIRYAELYLARCAEVATNPYEAEWIRIKLEPVRQALDKGRERWC